LFELFAASPRDSGWDGFLLAQVDRSKPVLWVQDRMAILESGRVYPPGMPGVDLIHVEARDARSALWAMEEGLRCSALSAVIGELSGDPAALDFTATRRLAVASERSGVACWLVRLGGNANLSGARMRWRIASAPSLLNPLDPRAPGACAWDAELFRARGARRPADGVAHEAGAFHLVAAPGDRAVGEAAASAFAPEHSPVVLTVEGTHGPIIHAVTKAAAERGARAGARLTDARALSPDLVAIPADPQGDKRCCKGWRAGRSAGRHWSRSMGRTTSGSTSPEWRICSAARRRWRRMSATVSKLWADGAGRRSPRPRLRPGRWRGTRLASAA
jgi:protein ImuA